MKFAEKVVKDEGYGEAIRDSILLPVLLLTGSHKLHYFALFCKDDRLRTHFTKHPKSLRKTRRFRAF